MHTVGATISSCIRSLSDLHSSLGEAEKMLLELECLCSTADIRAQQAGTRPGPAQPHTPQEQTDQAINKHSAAKAVELQRAKNGGFEIALPLFLDDLGRKVVPRLLKTHPAAGKNWHLQKKQNLKKY